MLHLSLKRTFSRQREIWTSSCMYKTLFMSVCLLPEYLAHMFKNRWNPEQKLVSQTLSTTCGMHLCTGRETLMDNQRILWGRGSTLNGLFLEGLLWQWSLKTRIRESKRKGTLFFDPWRSFRNSSLSYFQLLKPTLQGTSWTLLCASHLQRFF